MQAAGIDCADPNRLMASPPRHEIGTYASWPLRLSSGAVGDMVWRSTTPATQSALVQRILPHGEPSLAVRRIRETDGTCGQAELVVCGPSRQARDYRPAPGEELIAVRLHPEASADRFGLHPADYCGDEIVPPPEPLRNLFSPLIEKVPNLTPAQIARALLTGLTSYSGGAPDTRQVEHYAARLLRRSYGRINITRLAGHLEVSERHLRRRFHDAMGYSPKNYARRLRVSSAAALADNVAKPDWAGIAAHMGYCDQAHFVSDFRSLTGTSPARAHAARRAESVFCNTGN